jgi:hypothetical protein
MSSGMLRCRSNPRHRGGGGAMLIAAPGRLRRRRRSPTGHPITSRPAAPQHLRGERQLLERQRRRPAVLVLRHIPSIRVSTMITVNYHRNRTRTGSEQGPRPSFSWSFCEPARGDPTVPCQVRWHLCQEVGTKLAPVPSSWHHRSSGGARAAAPRSWCHRAWHTEGETVPESWHLSTVAVPRPPARDNVPCQTRCQCARERVSSRVVLVRGDCRSGGLGCAVCPRPRFCLSRFRATRDVARVLCPALVTVIHTPVACRLPR